MSQVAEIKKRILVAKTGMDTESVHHLVTSLSPQVANPRRLLADHRGHWGIENRLFHVKDNSFAEDPAVLASHRSASIMSLLKATVLNLLRGHSNL
jgi:predicted transposase YbfD/YdcC